MDCDLLANVSERRSHLHAGVESFQQPLSYTILSDDEGVGLAGLTVLVFLCQIVHVAKPHSGVRYP